MGSSMSSNSRRRRSEAVKTSVCEKAWSSEPTRWYESSTEICFGNSGEGTIGSSSVPSKSPQSLCAPPFLYS